MHIVFKLMISSQFSPANSLQVIPVASQPLLLQHSFPFQHWTTQPPRLSWNLLNLEPLSSTTCWAGAHPTCRLMISRLMLCICCCALVYMHVLCGQLLMLTCLHVAPCRYRPTLKVSYVASELAFQSNQQCLDFLKSIDVELTDPNTIDCKATANKLGP